MMDILKAKADAVTALVEALENRINGGDITSLASARSFLSTWQDAVNEMVPLEAYKAYTPAEPTTMAEPVEVGARVVDEDGEVWQRFSTPEDYPWGLVGRRSGHSIGRSCGSANWAHVLGYNPRPI